MPEFIACPDLHLLDSITTTRVDDILESQLTLLEEIMDKYPKAPMLLPGDVGDTRRWTNRAIVEFASLVTNSNREWYAELGQHDLRGHDIPRYEKDSSLYILEKLLSNFHVLRGSSTTHDKVKITGYSWGATRTQEFLEGGIEHKGIALCHASVSDGTFPGSTNVKDLLIKGTGYVVFGDIHTGFPPSSPRSNNEIICFGGGVLTPMKRSEQFFSCNFHIINTKTERIKAIPIHWSDEIKFTNIESTTVESFVSGEFMSLLEEANVQMKNEESLEKYVLRIARELSLDKSVAAKLLSKVDVDG